MTNPSVCYRIEKIIDVSTDGGNITNVKVQWEPTWVPSVHLLGAEKLIKEFLSQKNESSQGFDNRLAVDFSRYEQPHKVKTQPNKVKMQLNKLESKGKELSIVENSMEEKDNLLFSIFNKNKTAIVKIEDIASINPTHESIHPNSENNFLGRNSDSIQTSLESVEGITNDIPKIKPEAIEPEMSLLMYTCDLCEYNFPDLERLELHKREMHYILDADKEKEIQVASCQKINKAKSYMGILPSYLTKQSVVKIETLFPNELKLWDAFEGLFGPKHDMGLQQKVLQNKISLKYQEQNAALMHFNGSGFDNGGGSNENILYHKSVEGRNAKSNYHECSGCSLLYVNEESFDKHHCFSCRFCKMIFTDKLLFNQHLSLHKELTVQTQVIRIKTESHKKYKCSNCGRQFSFKSNFRKHTCSTCTICGHVFKTKSQLNRHLRCHRDKCLVGVLNVEDVFEDFEDLKRSFLQEKT